MKEYETKVLEAQERIDSLEIELFQKLRAAVALESPRLKAVARATAHVDVLYALAETAVAQRFCRPFEALRLAGESRQPLVGVG